jgi:hypothetical protein
MKLKPLTAVATLVACSGAWASDVTYKCVVEHRLGVQLPEMTPVRFKVDREYRIEPVEAYLEKTDGGKKDALWEFPEGNNKTLALRGTDKDPSDPWSWEVLESVILDHKGEILSSLHYSTGETSVQFDAIEMRMSLVSTTGARLWTLNDDSPASDYIDYATCTAYYD